jgi:hypothetical protein
MTWARSRAGDVFTVRVRVRVLVIFREWAD